MSSVYTWLLFTVIQLRKNKYFYTGSFSIKQYGKNAVKDTLKKE